MVITFPEYLILLINFGGNILGASEGLGPSCFRSSWYSRVPPQFEQLLDVKFV